MVSGTFSKNTKREHRFTLFKKANKKMPGYEL